MTLEDLFEKCIIISRNIAYLIFLIYKGSSSLISLGIYDFERNLNYFKGLFNYLSLNESQYDIYFKDVVQW